MMIQRTINSKQCAAIINLNKKSRTFFITNNTHRLKVESVIEIIHIRWVTPNDPADMTAKKGTDHGMPIAMSSTWLLIINHRNNNQFLHRMMIINQ